MATTTYLGAIRQGLMEEMRRDPAVFLLGQDIGVYGGAFKVTDGLLDEFGAERVMDTPIAETAIVGAAIGASMMGMRPVAEFQFIDFMGNAWNMINNFAARNRYRWGQGVPIVLRGPCGGGVHGGPFHSQNPEMYYAHTPGLKVVAPATAYDAKGLIKAAIRDEDPVLFFEHKFLYRRIKEDLAGTDEMVPLGKAAVIEEGDELTIICYGTMVHVTQAAARLTGVRAEIIDVRTLFPLDVDTLTRSVEKTGRCLVAHEATRFCGYGAELVATMQQECFWHLEAPIERVAGWDTPYPHAFEWKYFPGQKRLAAGIRKVMEAG